MRLMVGGIVAEEAQQGRSSSIITIAGLGIEAVVVTIIVAMTISVEGGADDDDGNDEG